MTYRHGQHGYTDSVTGVWTPYSDEPSNVPLTIETWRMDSKGRIVVRTSKTVDDGIFLHAVDIEHPPLFLQAAEEHNRRLRGLA